MAVLRDAAGNQDGRGNDPGGEEGDEDQVRSRFGNDADERGQQDHQRDVGADPLADVEDFRDEAQRDEHAERPGEDLGDVPDDDVVPQVFLHEMVGAEDRDAQHDQADGGEEHIHPVFAQQVESAVFRFFHPFVLMLQHAGRQRDDVEGDPDEEDAAFPGQQMPSAFLPFVHVLAGCFVLVFVQVFFVQVHFVAGLEGVGFQSEPGTDIIDQYAGEDADDQDQEGEPQGFSREEGQHYEGFVARGGDHHCDKGSEADHSVREERDRSEAAHAARNPAQQG